MTRDEAIKKASGKIDRHDATLTVDVLAALGVLKLEEPRSPEDELLDAVDAAPFGSANAGSLSHMLRNLKLKVVRA